MTGTYLTAVLLLVVTTQSGVAVGNASAAESLPSRQTTMAQSSGPGIQQVGGGNDDVVVTAPDGVTINKVTGSFEKTTNQLPMSTPNVVTAKTAGVLDAYTLQISTNYFATPRCTVLPQCGWEQFVFANDPNGPNCRSDRIDCGKLFIRYWLLSVGTCPNGWQLSPIGTGNCFQDSQAGPTDPPIPYMPFTTATMLAYKLTGNIIGNNVTFSNGATTYPRTGINNVFNIVPQVNQVEFNVLGLRDGTIADFNVNVDNDPATPDPVADFYVRMSLVYSDGSMTKPKCVTKPNGTTGFSSEGNNLFFAPKPPLESLPQPQLGPSVLFHERNLLNPNSASPACAAALTIGDTHERTIAGYEYDFQATGDFVEAQVGTGFEVQTRKGSGAPMWPNATVNKSVAVKMGATQVAVCDGALLVVDGRPTDLTFGGSVSLPTGVTVRRDGNVDHDIYLIKDPSGNIVRVTADNTMNPHYVDSEIGLVTSPVIMRGLLGSPDNDPNRIEARNGRTFTKSISFDDLYGVFGPSWRVAPIASMLTPCPGVVSGIPSAPMFITSFDPTQRTSLENFCRQAGITEEVWVRACALDVAVLGSRARAAFVGQPTGRRRQHLPTAILHTIRLPTTVPTDSRLPSVQPGRLPRAG